MRTGIVALLLACFAAVQALPLTETGQHKQVKRSAEAVLVGNHQNERRVKKSGPPPEPAETAVADLTDRDAETKQDTARDESAKVSVATNEANKQTHIDDLPAKEEEPELPEPQEENPETSEKESSEDENTEKESSEETPSESEAELSRLTEKEKEEIDDLLSQLNIPQTSPFFRDFKRSNAGPRWHSRHRRARNAALESSMSLKQRTTRSKRETWYPFVVQRRDMDYPSGYDYDYGAPYEENQYDNYDIPLTQEEEEEMMREIAEQVAEEEAEEAEQQEKETEAYPMTSDEGYDMTPDKRQYLSMTNGFKRSGTFYPYQEMERSPWAAAIRQDAEKRNIQEQYDHLYRLAEALRGEQK